MRLSECARMLFQVKHGNNKYTLLPQKMYLVKYESDVNYNIYTL